MTAPVTEPTTADAVAEQLGIHNPGPADLERLGRVVAAVCALLVEWFGDRGTETAGWPAHMQEGATMLAARVDRRRNSPAGVEALGELGPVYVSRNDPDVAQLLGLGRYAKPAVG